MFFRPEGFRGRTMQMAAYALTRLILFGFGWSIAVLLALAADFLLAGMKWPILGVLAALWTFICALYVAGEARARDPFEIRRAGFHNQAEPP
jgi:hypothetical protein